MDRWLDKVALVTGAGSGIGAAVTGKLSKVGVKVFGVDISKEKVEDLKKKIGPVLGEVIPIRCDIENNEEVLEAFKFVKNRLGAIHILVNAARIARYGLTSDRNVKHFKENNNVNVMGALYCTEQALKLMKESGVDDGQIIFLNGSAGHYVPSIRHEQFNVYAASKHGIATLTESLRQELVYSKSKIRVLSISPGKARSNFLANLAVGRGATLGKISEEHQKDDIALEPTEVEVAISYAITSTSHSNPQNKNQTCW